MDYHISHAELVMVAVIVAWDLAWRGIALWQSSQRRQKTWFVLLLIVNSAGLLPIAYLLLHGQSFRSSKGNET